MKILRKVSKEDLKNHLYNIDINDSNLYDELNNGGKIGIFQISGHTAAKFCLKVNPKNFSELTAVNALARPGVIESSGSAFIERKETGKSPYPAVVNKILEETHYTMLYQEQIMEIFHKIGGFSLEETNEVRGLMKKLGKAEKDPNDLKAWNKVIKKFIKGALKQGIDEKTAKMITNDLQAFAGYSFNKSHATAYAYVALMTLYLSRYFKPYWYSSVLTYEIDKKKYIKEYINTIRSQGISLLPPDINKSMAQFYPIDQNHIIFGLLGIKYVSYAAIDKIISNRPYDSLFDFLVKTRSRQITSACVKALVSSGAFDWYDTNRKKLLNIVEIFWSNRGNTKVEEKLKAIYNDAEYRTSLLNIKTSKIDLMNFEQDYFGMRIFAKPFDNELLEILYKLEKRNLVILDSNELDKFSRRIPIYISSIRIRNDRNGNEMAFVEAEDIYENNLYFPIFASYYKVIKDRLKAKRIYIINAYRSDRGIVFGENKFTTSEFKINRMLREIKGGSML